MKLFKVTLKGMTFQVNSGTAWGIAYVVAENTDVAYNKVKEYLDKKDIGFSGDRVLDKIELIAEDVDYPGSGIKLYL